jgi:Domain of unknown function (DUF1707)/2TM domain
MELEPSRRRASLRASDADREQIVFALRQHHGDGRLTVSEFTERMGLAYEAKTLGDLEVLTRDLPPLPPPLPEAPGLDPVSVIRWRFYRHLLSYACVNGFMIVLWLVASIAVGRILFFWPVWTLLGWGLALGSHGIRVFGPQEIREHPRDRHGDSFDHRSDPWGGHHAQYDRYRRGPDDPRGGQRTRPRVYR